MDEIHKLEQAQKTLLESIKKELAQMKTSRQHLQNLQNSFEIDEIGYGLGQNLISIHDDDYAADELTCITNKSPQSIESQMESKSVSFCRTCRDLAETIQKSSKNLGIIPTNNDHKNRQAVNQAEKVGQGLDLTIIGLFNVLLAYCFMNFYIKIVLFLIF